MDRKKKILVLVEGIRPDIQVMKRIFGMCPALEERYEIIPYLTNIYALYQMLFAGGGDNPEDFDLL